MTKDEVVKALVEQVVAVGFKVRLMTLDAGFYTVDVLNFVSQFKYVIAVPVGDVKVYEEFDGEYKTNSKRHRKDEQVEFRLLVYGREKGKRKKVVYFARATNLDLPRGGVGLVQQGEGSHRDLSPEHQGLSPLHQFHQVRLPHVDLRAGRGLLLPVHRVQGGGEEGAVQVTPNTLVF